MGEPTVQHADKKHDTGFTLLEMIVAVFVVGVMAAVIGPHLMGVGKRAQQMACEEDQRTIRAALTEYQLLYHAYPAGNTTQQLQALKDTQLLEAVPIEPTGANFVISDTDVNNVSVSCDAHGTLGGP